MTNSLSSCSLSLSVSVSVSLSLSLVLHPSLSLSYTMHSREILAETWEEVTSGAKREERRKRPVLILYIRGFSEELKRTSFSSVVLFVIPEMSTSRATLDPR